MSLFVKVSLLSLSEPSKLPTTAFIDPKRIVALIPQEAQEGYVPPPLTPFPTLGQTGNPATSRPPRPAQPAHTLIIMEGLASPLAVAETAEVIAEHM